MIHNDWIFEPWFQSGFFSLTITHIVMKSRQTTAGICAFTFSCWSSPQRVNLPMASAFHTSSDRKLFPGPYLFRIGNISEIKWRNGESWPFVSVMHIMENQVQPTTTSFQNFSQTLNWNGRQTSHCWDEHHYHCLRVKELWSYMVFPFFMVFGRCHDTVYLQVAR